MSKRRQTGKCEKRRKQTGTEELVQGGVLGGNLDTGEAAVPQGRMRVMLGMWGQ